MDFIWSNIKLINQIPYCIVVSIINLPVLTVKLADGPGPTLVCALSCSIYSVSGDNPVTVPISMFKVTLPKLSITLPLYCIEYFIVTPLGVSGGIHCKVTVVEVVEAIFSEHGSLGSKSNIILCQCR